MVRLSFVFLLFLLLALPSPAQNSDSRHAYEATAAWVRSARIGVPVETIPVTASTVAEINNAPIDFALCGASGEARPLLLAGTMAFVNSPSPRSHWEVTRHQQRFLVEVVPNEVIVYSDPEMRFHGFTLIPIGDIKSVGYPQHKNDLWLVEIESASLFQTVEVYSGRRIHSGYVDVPFVSKKDASQAIQIIARLRDQPACSR